MFVFFKSHSVNDERNFRDHWFTILFNESSQIWFSISLHLFSSLYHNLTLKIVLFVSMRIHGAIHQCTIFQRRACRSLAFDVLSIPIETVQRVRFARHKLKSCSICTLEHLFAFNLHSLRRTRVLAVSCWCNLTMFEKSSLNRNFYWTQHWNSYLHDMSRVYKQSCITYDSPTTTFAIEVDPIIYLYRRTWRLCRS